MIKSFEDFKLESNSYSNLKNRNFKGILEELSELLY